MSSRIWKASPGDGAGTRLCWAKTRGFRATCSRTPCHRASCRWGWMYCSLARCLPRASPTSPAACAPTPALSSRPRTTLTTTMASSSSARTATSSMTGSNTRSRASFSAARSRASADRRCHRQGGAHRRRAGPYIEYAKASFPRGLTLEGLRIVVDCAHGAAYKSTPCVLRELGAEIIVYGNQPTARTSTKTAAR